MSPAAFGSYGPAAGVLHALFVFLYISDKKADATVLKCLKNRKLKKELDSMKRSSRNNS